VASVTQLPFADERFDLVLSSDVLQHLTLDGALAATTEMSRVLRRGGRVVIRTNSAHGRRRIEERDDWRLYRVDSLRATLVGAGLVVERVTAVNVVQGLWASVPRPRHVNHAAGTLVDEHRAQHGLGIPEPVGPLKNRLLLAPLRVEGWWLRRPGRSLPFGHSLYAIARRP
jgi:SAM-dependent methyltransferase